MEALFRNDGLMSINYQIPASNSGKVLLQRKWAKHSATSLDKESTRTRTTWLEQEHEKFHNEELIHTRKSDAHLSKASKHHDHCVKPQQALQGPTQTTPSKAPAPQPGVDCQVAKKGEPFEDSQPLSAWKSKVLLQKVTGAFLGWARHINVTLLIGAGRLADMRLSID